MILRIALGALFLMGCTPAHERSLDESSWGAAALSAWQASGLPAPTRGRCDIASFRVRVVSASDFVQLCHTVPEAAYGCTSWDSTGEWFCWREIPIVVIAPWWKVEPSIVVHELMHAMYRCSGMPGAYSGANSQHLDPRVWSAAGGATSAQSRAMAIIAGQQ